MNKYAVGDSGLISELHGTISDRIAQYAIVFKYKLIYALLFYLFRNWSKKSIWHSNLTLKSFVTHEIDHTCDFWCNQFKSGQTSGYRRSSITLTCYPRHGNGKVVRVIITNYLLSSLCCELEKKLNKLSSCLWFEAPGRSCDIIEMTRGIW